MVKYIFSSEKMLISLIKYDNIYGMKRKVFEKLYKWKNSENRKPLLLNGARQVGKTWIMQNFGKEAFGKVVYINFENDRNYAKIFGDNISPDKIIENIEIILKEKINIDNTLIIFDEVQECERCLEAMKYFCEDDKNYYIMLAGSLLGVSIHSGISFPVGKVEEINIYPMTFLEFLMTQNEMLAEKIEKIINANDENDNESIEDVKAFHIDLYNYIKLYYIIGGMPEVIDEYNKTKDFIEVRNIQKRIIEQYEKDMSKHIDTSSLQKARMIYNAIPLQLAKENKKFFFGQIKKGARMKDFENAIEWLCDCGIIRKVYKVNDVKIPLKAYIDFSAFKLYVSDIGLLTVMSDIDSKVLLESNELFVEYKGALIEQFVAQELISNTKYLLYYYSSEKNTYEVDFLIQKEDSIIPIEVKAEENLKSKSLKYFVEKFSSKRAIKTSLKEYKKNEVIENVPLYLITMI